MNTILQFVEQVRATNTALQHRQYEAALDALCAAYAPDTRPHGNMSAKLLTLLGLSVNLMAQLLKHLPLQDGDYSALYSLFHEAIRDCQPGQPCPAVNGYLHRFYLILSAIKRGMQQIHHYADASQYKIQLVENDDGSLNMHLSAVVSGTGGLSPQQALELQAQFLAMFEDIRDNDSPSALTNLATQMMMEGQYHNSINAFKTILSKFPDVKASASTSIGANYFFLGEYETALQYYEDARAAGADPQQCEYNIGEVCATLAANATTPADADRWKAHYFNQYPNGPYFDTHKD